MRCFVCGGEKKEREIVDRIADKNVCKSCYEYLGLDPWNSKEEEVRSIIASDAKNRADPDRSGGRFKRHKG